MNNMIDISQSIRQAVEKLSYLQQYMLLAFIESMTIESSISSNLLQFAGSISSDELQTMQRAINSDCENIDEDGW